MAQNTNLQPEEITALESCKSETEWNAACDKIKSARGGAYPADWWPTMKLSGRMDRILASFGASSDIKVSVLPSGWFDPREI